MFKAIKRNVFVRELYITSGKFKFRKRKHTHTHKVIGVVSHKPRKRSLVVSGRLGGWVGVKTAVPGGVHAHGSELTEPSPTPPPSISTQQQNMTMLAFFISLTLPLIKQ
jgi:hypothetical protein